METVNLKKICELLEKGVDNPLIQNEEGKFSLAKWKTEVQAFTEPFLSVITERLNKSSMMQERSLWQDNMFKIMRKSSGKQTRLLSLQEAKCKLGDKFGVSISEGNTRLFEATVIVAPSKHSVEGKGDDCILWGLRWWGPKQYAEIAQDRLLKVNQGVGFTVLLTKDKAFGGSYAWLFNSIGANKLGDFRIDEIVDIIIKDFAKLSSILWDKREIFGGDDIVDLPPVRTPTRGDVERAVLRIWSENRQRKIDKTLVMKMIEADSSRKGTALKSDWWTSIEGKLEEWFG